MQIAPPHLFLTGKGEGMALYDNVLIEDWDKHTKSIQDASDWFKQLKYNPQFSTIFEQGRLNVMITGFNFLLDNLRELKLKYLVQPS